MRIGINGSPTWVRKTFTPDHRRGGVVTEKRSMELAEDMLNFLIEKNFLES